MSYIVTDTLPPPVQQVLPILTSLNLKQRISLINLLSNTADLAEANAVISVVASAEKPMSLYEHLMTTKPASFHDDPVEIQRQLRDGWS